RVADVRSFAGRRQHDVAVAGPLEDVRHVLQAAAEKLVAPTRNYERVEVGLAHRGPERLVAPCALGCGREVGERRRRHRHTAAAASAPTRATASSLEHATTKPPSVMRWMASAWASGVEEQHASSTSVTRNPRSAASRAESSTQPSVTRPVK